MNSSKTAPESVKRVPPESGELVYLALGSNQGDRIEQLREAVRRLGACVTVQRLSTVYETAAAYVTEQPPYLNMALEARTQLDPPALLACLKQIEREMGRIVAERWGPRPIDLDILLYGDRRIESPNLQIPHARMAERPFVLQPLAELAPTLTPPGLQSTIAELARNAPPIGDIIARLGPLSSR